MVHVMSKTDSDKRKTSRPGSSQAGNKQAGGKHAGGKAVSGKAFADKNVADKNAADSADKRGEQARPTRDTGKSTRGSKANVGKKPAAADAPELRPLPPQAKGDKLVEDEKLQKVLARSGLGSRREMEVASDDVKTVQDIKRPLQARQLQSPQRLPATQRPSAAPSDH